MRCVALAISSAISLLVCGVSPLPASVAVSQMRVLMGTLARVQVAAADSVTADSAVDAAFGEMVDVDLRMSTYRDDSEISRLNRAGGREWVTISPRFETVLREAARYGELSGGAFDHTVLPLMRLWGFRGGNPAEPTQLELKRCLLRVGHGYVALHPDGRRMRFTKDGVQVDLGGIAKGYALDLAAAVLRRKGATTGVVDLGGSFAVFGSVADSTVEVRSPTQPGKSIGMIAVRDAFVATSGGYENYVTIDGRRYGHILDPRTGRPVGHTLSVTVVASTGIAADALSTAVYVLGPTGGAALLDRTPDAEGVIVWEGQDGGIETYVTKGLTARFQRYQAQAR